jgi:hypothetical protein
MSHNVYFATCNISHKMVNDTPYNGGYLLYYVIINRIALYGS